MAVLADLSADVERGKVPFEYGKHPLLTVRLGWDAVRHTQHHVVHSWQRTTP